MQGQRSAIGSLPDSVNFEDQQLRWNAFRERAESRLAEYRIASGGTDSVMGAISQEARNLSIWNTGEPSYRNQGNLINHDERVTQNGWSSSTSASAGADPRLEDQAYDPTSVILRNDVNLNLNNNQIAGSTSFVRTSNNGSVSQSHDINVNQLVRVGGDHMECSNSSKSGGLEQMLLPSSSGSSEPFASSSGSGGFLVEEDDGRPGYSLDGRRLSCKRKTIEGNAGQSSSSGNFCSREGSMWQAVPPRSDVGSSSLSVSQQLESSLGVSNPDPVNPRLRLSMGGVAADSVRAPSVVAGAESSRRNYRVRMNPTSSLSASRQLETSLGVSTLNPVNPRLRLSMGGVAADSVCAPSVGAGAESSRRDHHVRMNPTTQQDALPNNSGLPRVTVGHSDVPAGHQPLRFIPVNPPLDLVPPIQSENVAPQQQPVVLHLPGLRRNLQSVRWNAASSARAGSSSVSPGSEERDVHLHEDLNSRPMLRNISEHPMFMPSAEVRNASSHNPTGWNPNGGSFGASRHIGSSSRAGSSSSSQSSTGPAWGSHRHTSSQYSRRLSEYARRSLLSSAGSESGLQSGSASAHRSASSSREVLLPSAGGSQGHNPSFARSALWMDRHGDGVIGIPYSLRTLAAGGEGRSRLVSEIRNVLDIMRRGEGLRFEDVMILDPSIFFGMADIHDQHRDMRLDVDNMSYEELLALEERIGNVCTGLSEETILARMKQRKYISIMKDDQTEIEPCCICQEEYNDGEDMGMLDCGHDFHTHCIKQWLAQKNLCPICKTTGLATT